MFVLFWNRCFFLKSSFEGQLTDDVWRDLGKWQATIQKQVRGQNPPLCRSPMPLVTRDSSGDTNRRSQGSQISGAVL